MELNRLTSKIISEAEAECHRIKQEHNARLKKLKEEIEQEREAQHRQEREKIKREMDKIRRREIGAKKIEEQNKVLSYQWEKIKEVLEEAKQRFQKDPDYLNCLKSIIKEYAEAFDTVILSPEDLPRLQKEFPDLKMENSQTLTAGVIIKKEKEEIDFSLDATLGVIWEEVIQEFKKYL